MPQFAVGDIWQEVGRSGALVVTTNSYINSAGCLVMGRGAAREAALRWPELPRLFGSRIRETCGHLGEYGFILISRHVLSNMSSDIGAFQVKCHFRDQAHLELIRMSVAHLKDHRYTRVVMNYPGIGNGRLREEDVRPLLEPLPHSVVVYRKATAP